MTAQGRARRPLRFGVFLTPFAAAHAAVVEQALAADEAGLELIGLQDHPYEPAFLDTLALSAELLARTARVSVFTDVANLLLRPPAMLAKAAASLDVLSGGRFELGLGAGGMREAAVGMGAPDRDAAASVEALEEAVGIVRAALAAQGALRHHGRHYQLPGYQPGPRPPHPVGVWLGAYGPRMLELTGRLADGWVPSMPHLPPAAAAAAQARIDEAARRAGRDPSDITRVYNLAGRPGAPARPGMLGGSAEQWATTLASFVTDLGFDTFVLPVPPGDATDVAWFGKQVAPLVSQLLATREAAGV